MFKKIYACFGPRKINLDVLHLDVQNPKAHTDCDILKRFQTILTA